MHLFNTLYGGIECPACQQKVVSGVGFKLGQVAHHTYKIGDELRWGGENCRPSANLIDKDADVIKTVGYYNCDNIRCQTWQDCYPQVQIALITVERNVIKAVECFEGPEADQVSQAKQKFPILEPAHLAGVQ